MLKLKGFYHQKCSPNVAKGKLFESRNLIDGSDSHVRQKRFSFPKTWGVRDGLLGVVSVGGGKQNITA